MKSDEHILADIDATLDQLIQNAETLNHVSLDTLSTMEVEALQKTQESLIARLCHMDELIDADKKQRYLQKQNAFQLERKIAHYSQLNKKLIQDVAKRFKVKSTKRIPSER